MCEQCEAKTNLYLIAEKTGIFDDKMFLTRATRDGNMMKKGDWGLDRGGDPDFIFTITPEPNPFWGMTDKQLDMLPDQMQDMLTAWESKSENFGKELLASILMYRNSHYFSTIRRLMDLCKEQGWVPDAITLEQWLFHYLGSFLTAAVPTSEKEADDV